MWTQTRRSDIPTSRSGCGIETKDPLIQVQIADGLGDPALLRFIIPYLVTEQGAEAARSTLTLEDKFPKVAGEDDTDWAEWIILG